MFILKVTGAVSVDNGAHAPADKYMAYARSFNINSGVIKHWPFVNESSNTKHMYQMDRGDTLFVMDAANGETLDKYKYTG